MTRGAAPVNEKARAARWGPGGTLHDPGPPPAPPAYCPLPRAVCLFINPKHHIHNIACRAVSPNGPSGPNGADGSDDDDHADDRGLTLEISISRNNLWPCTNLFPRGPARPGPPRPALPSGSMIELSVDTVSYWVGVSAPPGPDVEHVTNGHRLPLQQVGWWLQQAGRAHRPARGTQSSASHQRVVSILYTIVQLDDGPTAQLYRSIKYNTIMHCIDYQSVSLFVNMSF